VSTGLLALLDDLTALAKIVSASVDDAATQAAKAGSKAITKASGIVIDDAAVTPRYVIGFAADRELPIIARIAVGSLKNKLLFLLPGALLINYFTPWVLTPLLMLGGVYLAYEGYGKVADLFRPDDGAAPASPDAEGSGLSKELENARVASAVRTDFILSAEILAITLSTVASASVGVQAAALSIVGIGMTVAVYGAVALIVKADDAGAALAQNANALVSAVGRGIVRGMPLLLALLGTVGMVAMLWVGGGILIHGAHELGWKAPEQLLQSLGTAAGRSMAAAAGLVSWVVTAGISAVVGLAVGAVAAPVAGMFSGARRISNENG
jgi:predicted DNA repair protein MutK